MVIVTMETIMATISSHVLDSVLGTHASGIRVQGFRCDLNGESALLFDQHADEQGRFSQQIALLDDDVPAEIELVFHSKHYFQQHAVKENGPQIMEVVLIKLALPDANGNYHVPMMLSPHSYSVWWSAPTPA